MNVMYKVTDGGRGAPPVVGGDAARGRRRRGARGGAAPAREGRVARQLQLQAGRLRAAAARAAAGSPPRSGHNMHLVISCFRAQV